MNTLLSQAAPPSAPRSALHSRAARALTVLTLAVALPLVTACSSGNTDSSASPATASRTPAGASLDPSNTAASASSFATPTAGANGDPFCDLAVAAQVDALATEATTAQFETLLPGIVDGSAPIGSLNAWGTELAALTQSSLDFYVEAGPYVAGTEAEGPFTAMTAFLRDYSIPLANLAATATDSAAFVEGLSALVSAPGAQQTIYLGPEAAAVIAPYISERCPADE